MNHGLYIGINDYPGTDLDLAGCVNDAEDWRRVCGPACATNTVLLDDQATRQRIVEEVESLLEKLGKGDWAIITFSGHGTWVPDESGDEPDGRDEGLVPYDYDNILLDDQMRELAIRRPAGSRVLLICDSCHSGTVHRMIRPQSSPTRLRFMDPRSFLTGSKLRAAVQTAGRFRLPKPQYVPDVVLLAGCCDWEYSYDAEFNGRPNGAFTRAALDALTGKPLPFRTWYRRIMQHLPTYDYPQTPQMLAYAKDSRLQVPFTKTVTER